jgi:hypothetical protein
LCQEILLLGLVPFSLFGVDLGEGHDGLTQLFCERSVTVEW